MRVPQIDQQQNLTYTSCPSIIKINDDTHYWMKKKERMARENLAGDLSARPTSQIQTGQIHSGPTDCKKGEKTQFGGQFVTY